MTSHIADGVMAATHKLVQQAMTGQWQDVPRTVEERRLLLDQLSASAQPQDQQWLNALRQAMAESDAVVAQIRKDAPLDAPTLNLPRRPGEGTGIGQPGEATESIVDNMLDMIRGK
jgi:hypothetical protein